MKNRRKQADYVSDQLKGVEEAKGKEKQGKKGERGGRKDTSRGETGRDTVGEKQYNPSRWDVKQGRLVSMRVVTFHITTDPHSLKFRPRHHRSFAEPRTSHDPRLSFR